MEAREFRFTVEPSSVGERLDAYLATMSGASRSRVGNLIRSGEVLLNGTLPSKAGVALRLGDALVLRIPPPPPSEALPEALPLTVVYEDAHLLVVNKAADMVVHPSAGHDTGTLVNALVHRYGVLAPDLGTEDGRPRPGIVHRLDLGTSGVLVVARDEQTRDALSAAIAAHEIQRTYIAIVHGTKLPNAGTWRTHHDRHPKDRRRFTSKTDGGRLAVTHFEVMRRGRLVSLIRCHLETGRTHQIRVHCADHGAPIVGDALYGGVRSLPGPEGAVLNRLERQALHALSLAFIHPMTGQRVLVHGMPPSDLTLPLRKVFEIDDAVAELGGS